MAFKSLTTWRDLTDGHLYHEGDSFPFDGREIAPDRLAELQNGNNQAGLRLILACEDKGVETEARKEEAPKAAAEGRKTRKRTKK